MLELSLLELVFRAIPECLLMVLAVLIFSKSKINKREFLRTGFILTVIVFLIRKLPISYGVHTILNIITLIATTSYLNNIDVIKSMKYGIYCAILLFICEGVNIGMLNVIYGKEMSNIIQVPIKKIIYGMPSLIFFGISIMIVYIVINKRRS